MNPNDEVLAYGRENNVGDQYNDIILTTLRDTYDSSASLTDLYGKAWLSGLRDGNTLTLPTLHLPFTRLKQLDSRITFTRASNATYFDASGVMQTAAEGVARFDHNPSTGESLGLLIEEARTNLLTYSEQFDYAAWLKTNSTVTANTIIAPNGTLSGSKIIETTATGSHQLTQQVTAAAGLITATFYVKASDRNYCQIRFQEGGSFMSRAEFNLATGQAIAVSGSLPTITNVGNGWYQISLTDTSAGSATFQAQLWIYQNSTTNSYTGDGTSGLYIWGAQLEAGAFPTSYIKTEATALTRAADLASMTGTNFSSWYNQSEGTFTFVGNSILDASVRYVCSVDDGTLNEFFGIRAASATVISSAGIDGGVSQWALTGGTYTSGDLFSATLAYKVNDVGISLNGQSVATDTAVTLPTVTTLRLGLAIGLPWINGHISRLTYYPKRLPDTTLQVLSA